MEPLWKTGYYTIILRYTESPQRTVWHPTQSTGPFATLSRGAFRTKESAHSWAVDHLGADAEYNLLWIDGVTEDDP